MRGIRRQVVIVLLGVAAALAVIVVRLLVDARSAYRNGAAAEDRGEISEAIRYYLDAGRLYVPGSPFTRNALDRLDAIGVAQVTKGDYATARAAFEAERAALLGTRSFYTPYADRLPSLERRLSRLLAAAEDRASPATFEERAKWHAERLAERPRPQNPMVSLALLGLAMWVASAVTFFRKGVDANLALRRTPAMLASAGFLVGLALFLISLRLA
jgi:hypothetical protein